MLGPEAIMEMLEGGEGVGFPLEVEYLNPMTVLVHYGQEIDVAIQVWRKWTGQVKVDKVAAPISSVLTTRMR